MKLVLFDHHGKAELLHDALAADDRFEPGKPPEVIIADTDSPHSVPAWKFPYMKAQAEMGARIGLFQHGAQPQVEYDGIRKWYLPVSRLFVHGEGHAEIYRRIGLTVPVTVIGWAYSAAVPPGDVCVGSGRGSGESQKPPALLFAPLHPWADGKNILPTHRQLNQLAYDQFLTLEGTKTVRMWGEDDPNGIRHRHPDVQYTQATLGIADAQRAVDAADVVIGYGTIAYLALARGKRVIMYGSDLPPTDDHGRVNARHWDDYRDIMRYPVDLADGPAVTLLDNYPDERVAEWVELFVGGPFRPDVFCDAVAELRPNRAERRRLAKAAR